MRILRLYHINKVLLEHGLDELIPGRWLPWYVRFLRHCIFWIPNRHKDKSAGARIMLALQALGPVFIKFGQMLSTRRDLLPPHIANELALLQDRVAPFDTERAQHIIRQSLQVTSLDEVFSEFDTTPLASASIAQVHAAKLKDGDIDVVVKVLRPDIRKTIVADTELMMTLAKVLQKWLPDGKRLRPVEVVKEYEKTIVDELDLTREAANGMQLGRNFEGSEALYVPTIYSDYCRANVLVMERIYGIPISNIEALIEQNTNLRILAERGVEVFFTQSDTAGRDLGQFVIIEVTEYLFQAHFSWRCDADSFIGTGSTHIGKLFLFANVDHQVVVFAVFTDNHAGINFLCGIHEQGPSILQVEQGKGGRGSIFESDQNPVITPGQSATMWNVVMETVVQDPGSPGERQQLRAKSEQTPGGDDKLEAYRVGSGMKHIFHYTLALSHRLHHRPAEISGGEKQRVSVARALVNEPGLLLADEPTGALDKANSDKLVELLVELNEKRGLTLLAVSHSPEVASRMGVTHRLDEGGLFHN